MFSGSCAGAVFCCDAGVGGVVDCSLSELMGVSSRGRFGLSCFTGVSWVDVWPVSMPVLIPYCFETILPS